MRHTFCFPLAPLLRGAPSHIPLSIVTLFLPSRTLGAAHYFASFSSFPRLVGTLFFCSILLLLFFLSFFSLRLFFFFSASFPFLFQLHGKFVGGDTQHHCSDVSSYLPTTPPPSAKTTIHYTRTIMAISLLHLCGEKSTLSQKKSVI